MRLNNKTSRLFSKKSRKCCFNKFYRLWTLPDVRVHRMFAKFILLVILFGVNFSLYYRHPNHSCFANRLFLYPWSPCRVWFIDLHFCFHVLRLNLYSQNFDLNIDFTITIDFIIIRERWNERISMEVFCLQLTYSYILHVRKFTIHRAGNF